MDRWKEGYNDCDMEWRRKIQKEIDVIEKMTKERDFAYPVYRYCKNMLEDLLKRG